MPRIETPPRLNDYRVLVRSADGARNYPKTIRAGSLSEATVIVREFGEELLDVLPEVQVTPPQPVVGMTRRELEKSVFAGTLWALLCFWLILVFSVFVFVQWAEERIERQRKDAVARAQAELAAENTRYQMLLQQNQESYRQAEKSLEELRRIAR